MSSTEPSFTHRPVGTTIIACSVGSSPPPLELAEQRSGLAVVLRRRAKCGTIGHDLAHALECDRGIGFLGYAQDRTRRGARENVVVAAVEVALREQRRLN